MKPVRLVKGFVTVGFWTLVSRVAGLVRDIFLARYLGDGTVAQAFVVAQSLPNMFRRFFAEGAFNSFGVQSRYGFIFSALGVKPAGPNAETGLHGQPISSEFILQANPDIIFVVDRTAVMERRPVMDARSMDNPLLRQTKAWKNGRVIFVDAQAWYVTGASPTSLKLIIDDVEKGYQR